jgi:predicted PurR-regulated permease PerM
MFWWLGLSGAFLWGVIMGLLAIVPIFGAFIVWVPASIYLAMQGDWIKALILAIWGGVVISLIDNVLYPVFVGKRLRLHTLPVFFAIVGGLLVFGMSGLVLGPLVLALAIALLNIWWWRTSAGRAPEDGLAA